MSTFASRRDGGSLLRAVRGKSVPSVLLRWSIAGSLRNIAWSWLAIVATGLLAACGGGGGSDDPGIAGPAISVQPSDQSVVEGGNVTLAVTATGDVTYQWQRFEDGGWVALAGATSARYTLDEARATDHGARYRVLVTAARNPSNVLISSVATLSVSPASIAPVVLQSPADLTVLASEAGASFHVTASGTQLVYQWERSTDGTAYTAIVGATSSSLLLPPVQPGDDGTHFRVRVSNAAGSVTSGAARLQVRASPTAPLFTREPAALSVTDGQSANFSVAVVGSPQPTLQWHKSSDGITWVPLGGETGSSLSFTARVGDSGSRYRVAATNPQGTVTSAEAVLNVAPSLVAPRFTAEPDSVTVGEYAYPVFSASAQGSPTPTYQWQISTDGGVSFTNVVGGWQGVLQLQGTTVRDNGKQFRVIATNGGGSTTSRVATLTVVPGPQILQHVQSVTWDPALTDAAFQVVASGPNLSYQWQHSRDAGKNWVDVPGRTGSSHVISGPFDDAVDAVRVKVSNGGGTQFSEGLLMRQPWRTVYPRPTGHTLHAVAWVDVNTIVAVGEGSEILRSADRGATWKTVYLGGFGSGEKLGVAFKGQIGIAVGNGGQILRSTDGGRTWYSVFRNFTLIAPLSGVAWVDATTVVVAGHGGVLIRSIDAGLSWSDVVEQDRSTHFIDVAFSSAGVGLAVSIDGKILRSINGGAQWSPVASGANQTLGLVAFATPSIAVAVGYRGLLRSTDAGQSWQPVVSPALTNTNQGSPVAVSFANGYGLMVMIDGQVLRSDDNGATWNLVWSRSDWGYQGATVSPFDGTVVAVGLAGQIRLSTTGGQSWTGPSADARHALRGVAFASPYVAVAVGSAGTVLRSADGGDTWSQVASGSTAQLEGVAFGDASTGVAVAFDGTVLRTVDGGSTWTSQSTGILPSFSGVAFASPSVAVIATTYGLLRSTDGGATWAAPATNVLCFCRAVAFGSATVGVAVGAGGDIARTVDGGQTWHSVPAGTSEELWAVAFADARNAVAVGAHGVSVRSSDGGASWQKGPLVDGSGGQWQNGIAFASPTDGVAVGLALHRTVDMGQQWWNESTAPGTSLTAIAFSGNRGIAVGASGMILRTTPWRRMEP